MSLLGVVFLLLISMVCARLKLKRWALIGFLLSALLFTLVLTGLLPQLILNQLQTYPRLRAPAWQSKNTIILLGGGAVQWQNEPSVFSTQPQAASRVLETARLYFDCKQRNAKCVVLTTGGDLKNFGVSEGAVMAQELEALGVKKEDLLVEGKSRTTYENALFSKEIVPADTQFTVLVTSGTHMQRATKIFSYFKIATVSAPSDQLSARFALGAVTQNFFILDVALHEYGGMVKFYFQSI